MQREAVIVDAVRTAIGRRNGALKSWHPVDLLAYTLKALIARTGLDPAKLDDVIAGCVTQVGEQAMNVGRNAVLAAGLPDAVPGVTIDRQCGSSQQAFDFAAQGIIAGAYDIVISCGVESMTRVPLGVNATIAGQPFGPCMNERYGGVPFHQGHGAEEMALKWHIDRQALDEYSLLSHRRAASATASGAFAQEIIPTPILTGDITDNFCRDEGIRSDTSLEKLMSLKPVFRENGNITAGNSSQISDGAAAVLVMERGVAERLGYKPMARFVASAVAGSDPVLMLAGPMPATRKVLDRTGLKLDDMDRIEVNEAFASVVLAWQREAGADLSRVNVNGGAIALGHPVGASGARLMTTLVHELVRSGGRYGLQTMCEGGGTANATIIERLTQ
jgi:acetyl-CoA acetyltransferase family protein